MRLYSSNHHPATDTWSLQVLREMTKPGSLIPGPVVHNTVLWYRRIEEVMGSPNKFEVRFNGRCHLITKENAQINIIIMNVPPESDIGTQTPLPMGPHAKMCSHPLEARMVIIHQLHQAYMYLKHSWNLCPFTNVQSRPSSNVVTVSFHGLADTVKNWTS